MNVQQSLLENLQVIREDIRGLRTERIYAVKASVGPDGPIIESIDANLSHPFWIAGGDTDETLALLASAMEAEYTDQA